MFQIRNEEPHRSVRKLNSSTYRQQHHNNPKEKNHHQQDHHHHHQRDHHHHYQQQQGNQQQKTNHKVHFRSFVTTCSNKFVGYKWRGLILSISLPLFMIFAKMAEAHPVKCNVVTMFRLKTADCVGRGLSYVPADLDPDLKVFKLSSNDLISLEFVDFHKYVHLHEISLTQNHIEFIYPLTFAQLKLLQVLDLEGNSMYEVKEHFFANVSSLRVLILKNNPLHKLADRSFQNLFNLEVLSLENCFLTSFNAELMKDLKKLQELSLANNRLISLDETMLGYMPRSLTVVRLSGNSWQCDCKIRWFRRWLSDNSVNWNFPKNAPTCFTPNILRGVEWGQLKHDQFTCPARILVNASSQTVHQIMFNSSLTIDCVVFGDPMPIITWHKGGYDYYPPRHNIVAHGNINNRHPLSTYVSSLKIYSASANDEGDYKCVAENPAGRSEVTFKVIVMFRDVKTGDRSELFRSSGGEILLGVGVGISVLIVVVLVAVLVFLFKNKTTRSRLFISSSTLNGSACKRAKSSSTASAESAKKIQSLERETSDEKMLKENYYIFAPALESTFYHRSSPSHESGTFRVSEPFIFPELVSEFFLENYEAALESQVGLDVSNEKIQTPKSPAPAPLSARSAHSSSTTSLSVSTTPRQKAATHAAMKHYFCTLDESSRKKQQKVNFSFEVKQKLPNGSGLSRSSLDFRRAESDDKTPFGPQTSGIEMRTSKIELPPKHHSAPKSALKRREMPVALVISNASNVTAAAVTSTGSRVRTECSFAEHPSSLQRRLSFELAMEELHKDGQRSKSGKF